MIRTGKSQRKGGKGNSKGEDNGTVRTVRARAGQGEGKGVQRQRK